MKVHPIKYTEEYNLIVRIGSKEKFVIYECNFDSEQAKLIVSQDFDMDVYGYDMLLSLYAFGFSDYDRKYTDFEKKLTHRFFNNEEPNPEKDINLILPSKKVCKPIIGKFNYRIIDIIRLYIIENKLLYEDNITIPFSFNIPTVLIDKFLYSFKMFNWDVLFNEKTIILKRYGQIQN